MSKETFSREASSEVTEYPAPPPADTLRIVPLGGLGEFGKNCMALEYGGDAIMIDSGFQFPEEEMLGVDLVIPDFSYVMQQADRMRGIVLTHGHEDHIGSVAYLLREFDKGKLAIYGTKLTLAFVRERLQEYGLEKHGRLIEVAEGDRIQLGIFDIEFIPVQHSCPQACALAIRLPIGVILHTGDYRLDDEKTAFEDRLREIAPPDRPSPVLLLMSDSTNIDRAGHSPSESQVREGLRPVIADATAMIVLATFSSNLFRVQTLLDLAEEHGRKVAVCGYSLERNFEIATRLGILRYRDSLICTLQELMRLPPRQRMVLTTGTQGEPMSALSRMAFDSYKGLHLQPGDLVVLSSRIIPATRSPFTA